MLEVQERAVIEILGRDSALTFTKRASSHVVTLFLARFGQIVQSCASEFVTALLSGRRTDDVAAAPHNNLTKMYEFDERVRARAQESLEFVAPLVDKVAAVSGEILTRRALFLASRRTLATSINASATITSCQKRESLR